MRSSSDVRAQLDAAGLSDFVIASAPTSNGTGIRGRMRLAALQVLAGDPRFASGPLYRLHHDVGADLTEYRSHPGELVEGGSLQIVIDKRSGQFYADLDRFNPYSDLVNATGHAGEVVVPWFKKIGRWFRKGKR